MLNKSCDEEKEHTLGARTVAEAGTGFQEALPGVWKDFNDLGTVATRRCASMGAGLEGATHSAV